MKVFNELTPYNNYLNLAAPPHPLMDSRVCKNSIPNFPQSSSEIQVNLYKISLKKNFPGQIKYGSSTYNTDNGLLLFSEPGQVVSWDSLTFWDGYSFVFHPDLIKKHPIANKIRQYKYFSYEINDALFFTPEEEEIITWLFTKIHYELVNNRDNANTDVILSLLNVVLTYSEAFYERQFKETALQANSTVAKVKILLQEYYSNLSAQLKDIPTVSYIAAQLHLSPNYLTNLVRAETGKSTVTLIHEFIAGQAEILLLQTDINISDVAYRLGFESPAYFSRLFKKVRGKSPLEVRNQGKV